MSQGNIKPRKEGCEPINVRVSLKTFLESKKADLKKNREGFIGIPETLMYYLEDSPLFINDFSEHCGTPFKPKKVSDSLKVEFVKRILKFSDEDLLGLLTKKV